MKKIISTILLSLICFHPSFTVSANQPDRELDYNFLLSPPCKCVDTRWEYIGRHEQIDYYYDPETIVFLNKYNPFADKKVNIWIYRHNHFAKTSADRYLNNISRHYKINIDKRTLQFEYKEKVITRQIEPLSDFEVILNFCKKQYNK